MPHTYQVATTSLAYRGICWDCRGICYCADILGPDSRVTWRGHPSGCFRERKKTRPRRAFITVTQTGMSPLCAAGATFSSHTRWISFCTILLFIQQNYYHAIKKTWAGVHSKLLQEVTLLTCMQGMPGSDPNSANSCLKFWSVLHSPSKQIKGEQLP